MSLVAEDLSFSYTADTPVLRTVNLTVDAGERVALVAPSGTGKTTLCRLLAGYLVPDAGRVLVDGVSLGALRRGPRPVQLIWQHPEQAFDPRARLWRSLAEGLGASDHLVRDTRNARSFRSSRRSERVIERLRATGLLERFGVRETWLTRMPHELSGGELMRLALVRALLSAPRYLVCDEMTAMLDACTQAQVWHEVIALADEQKMGLVVVSHSPALLERIATREVAL